MNVIFLIILDKTSHLKFTKETSQIKQIQAQNLKWIYGKSK
jgi:hypothetical protein